jgi:hypothetical protein
MIHLDLLDNLISAADLLSCKEDGLTLPDKLQDKIDIFYG